MAGLSRGQEPRLPQPRLDDFAHVTYMEGRVNRSGARGSAGSEFDVMSMGTGASGHDHRTPGIQTETPLRQLQFQSPAHVEGLQVVNLGELSAETRRVRERAQEAHRQEQQLQRQVHATELRHGVVAVFNEDFLVELLGPGKADGGVE